MMHKKDPEMSIINQLMKLSCLLKLKSNKPILYSFSLAILRMLSNRA